MLQPLRTHVLRLELCRVCLVGSYVLCAQTWSLKWMVVTSISLYVVSECSQAGVKLVQVCYIDQWLAWLKLHIRP